jgi:diguanylate cyclase
LRGLFILFFPDKDPADFARSTVPELNACLQAPYVFDTFTLVCPVQIGAAVYPQDGSTLDEIVTAGDEALQTAEERDKNFLFFDRAGHTMLSRHYRLEPRLRRGLEKGEFVNYYQPKIDLATGRITSVEALMRWNEPGGGVVAPCDFIPAMESTGLIEEAGRQVIARAITDWQSWRAAGVTAPRIAVNVAAQQLRNDALVHSLEAALALVDGSRDALSIEVTESIPISYVEQAINVLTRVRAIGIPVSIDDFGTGYSSLSYLVRLPIDEIKVDREFVKRLATSTAYRGIVHASITLAHNLKLNVVAEGVETEEQASILRSLQCDQVQGYLYSKPVTSGELLQLLVAQVAPQ